MFDTIVDHARILLVSLHQIIIGRTAVLALAGAACVAVLASFLVVRLMSAMRPRPEPGPPLRALSAAPPFAAEVARSASETGVPVPPLNVILVSLKDAGVCPEEIAQRLQGAAEELARLRSSLSDVHAEALPLIDSGDLDAASAALYPPDVANGADPESRRDGARLCAAAAAIDHLRLDYQGAAAKYAAAADLVAGPAGAEEDPEAGKEEWGFRMDQAGALAGDGHEFGNRSSFAAAIGVYQHAVKLAPRPAAPHEWAATHFHLGNTLLAAGECDKDPDRVEEAIDAYLLALEEWTRERNPFDWARAQNSLGDALRLLGEDENSGDWLAPATEAYRAALQEWTHDHAPALWAMTQGNLADALLVMGVRGGDKERLEEAAAAYRAALGAQDRALAPLDWAAAQNNLGNALQSLGVLEPGTERLREAVAAYRAALEERTRDKAPSCFATTSNNLGNALLALAERDGSVRTLDEAAAAYRAALEERAKESEPVEAAKIQVNLAYALGALWSRTRNRRLPEEAIALLDAAIAVFEDAGEDHPLPDAESARLALLSATGRAA